MFIVYHILNIKDIRGILCPGHQGYSSYIMSWKSGMFKVICVMDIRDDHGRLSSGISGMFMVYRWMAWDIWPAFLLSSLKVTTFHHKIIYLYPLQTCHEQLYRQYSKWFISYIQLFLYHITVNELTHSSIQTRQVRHLDWHSRPFTPCSSGRLMALITLNTHAEYLTTF